MNKHKKVKNILTVEEKTQKINSIILITLSFLLPATIMLCVYANMGVYPFGDKSILIMDLNPIADIFASIKNFWSNNTSFFYSWSKAMGGNNIGNFAFYLSSPLSVITFFFPNVMLPTAVMVINVLKIGFAGLTFCLYLMFVFKKNDLSLVVFSLFYALMSYSVVYSMCLMWLDGFIWLPIVLIGVEKLLKDNKPIILIFSLMAVFISTYYISYMIGIFCLIYFIYRYFTTSKGLNIISLYKKLCIFFISTIASICLSAWLLYPAYISLGQGKLGQFFYSFDIAYNFNFVDVFSKLFIGSYDSITYSGLPNIFCGMAVVALVFGYFFIKSISIKEKIFSFLMIALFLLSFYIKNLDIIWHVFQNPNWFPYRYSFIFSFFMILIAFKAFIKVKEIPVSIFILFISICCFIYLFIFKMKYAYLPENAIYFSLFILAFYIILLCGFKIKRNFSSIILVVLVLLSIFEMSSNALTLVKGLDRDFIYSTNSSYVDFNSKITPLVEKANSLESGFFRMDKTFQRSSNDALNYGYNGFSQYTAVYNKDVNYFLKNLGFAQDWIWSSYNGSTILTDSLFGVKYVMSPKKINDFYIPIQKSENVTLYQNPYALSLAFMGGESLFNPSINSDDFLGNQNKMLKSITNSTDNYFNRIKKYKTTTQDIEIQPQDGFIRYSNKNGNGSVTFKFEVSDEKAVYASFISDTDNNGCDMYVNGKFIGRYLESGETKHNIYVGNFEIGQNVELKLQLASSKLDIRNQYLYALDMNKFTQAIDSIRQQELKITHFSSTKVEGDINVTDKTTMFTSIPFDKGWTVSADGKMLETKMYANTLMCVTVPQGQHKIEMRFSPEGFHLGLIISIGTLILIIEICLISKYKKGKRKKV